MAHLDSKVQQYHGFTPGRRFFGRDPKFPIAPVGIPNVKDFTHPNPLTVTKGRGVSAELREMHKASLESDPQGNLIYR